jgi:hypothetical protein
MGTNNKSIVISAAANSDRCHGRTAGRFRHFQNYRAQVPCYNFVSPERVNVEADPVISSAGGSIIPRIIAILVL